MTRLVDRRRFIVIAGSAALVSACSTPGPKQSRQDNRPEASDVAGRKPVPGVEVLTKTSSADPVRYEMARLMAEAWNAAGIKATLTPVETAALNTKAFTGKDYDVLVITYAATPERLDPDNLLSRFYSANATQAGSNVSQYKNAAFDRAYLAQAKAADATERVKAVREAQQTLYDQQPAVPIAYQLTGAAYRSDRWSGIEPALGNTLYNVWNSTDAKAKDGRDRLVVGTTYKIATLNPVAAVTAETQVPISHLYDTLLAVGRDGKIKNRAAKNVSTSGSTVTVELREGMKFSDGRDVTAEDVAFSFTYLRDHKAPLFGPALSALGSATANGNTITFRLKQQSASFQAVALAQVPILPRHVWSSVRTPAAFANEKPVGSGPFTFADRGADSSLALVANRSHYSPPSVGSLKIVLLGSFQAGIGGITTGEIDIFDDGQPASQYDQLKDREGVSVVEAESFGWRGLHYNMAREPFNDRHFRRALTALIPIDDIVDVALGGKAKVASSIIAPALKEWNNQGLEPFRQDPAAAMTELTEAGYAFGPDGRLYFPPTNSDKRVFDNAT